MPQRTPESAPKAPRAARRLRVTNPHAAGIDVHAEVN
jgi:hypothetical protein